MSLEIFRYVVIISMSGVLSLILALYAYLKRRIFSSSTIFILMSIFSAIYIFGHALELSSTRMDEIKFWLKIQYFGMPYIPPLSLMLTLQFCGLERFIRPKFMIPLFIIPFITNILSATNDLHHLFYRSVYFRANEVQPLIDIIPGSWYIVHGSFTFGCMILGTFILISYWYQTKANYWKQIATMIIGFIIPMAASFLYLLGLTPNGMDPVPIVMCFTSSLYLWAILSTKLFVLAPIARERVFENMRDGVIVVDTNNRIVDFNYVAESIIANLNITAIGKEIEVIWNSSGMGNFPFQTEELLATQECEQFNSYTEKYYQIHHTPVRNNKGITGGRIIVLIDITKQKALENRLKQLAYLDGLTQIFNRATLIERSSQQLEKIIQNKKHFSIIMFDIDFFKKINDRYGHNVGDLAICHVVAICKRILNREALFGRYGGEEFVICLPNLEITKACQLADKIRSDIEATPLIDNGHTISITASFGVSHLEKNTQTFSYLLKEADRALYASKANGRNTIYQANKECLIPFREKILVVETAVSQPSN